MLYLPCFIFTLPFFLRAKLTILCYQVIAVLYLHVKIKKGFFVVVGRWWKQLGEIAEKGFRC